ncbi:MAG TPA: AAA domain-containing protein [Ktedonobacteraceae bacterium]|nr:AAA domain-containing protein [Ktedonobacteraceae bacterium]
MSSTFRQSNLSPQARADQALREILTLQWKQEPGLIIQSPPGGGKTGIVERVAIQELALLHGRAMIATLTNEQTFDLARRLTAHYPRYPIYLFVRADLPVAQDLLTIANLVIVRNSTQLPKGPCVILANAQRWLYDSYDDHFTCLILDEAYQLPYSRFLPLASMADRLVLVGDPGQIGPVITCNIDRWKSEPAGPHLPCPQALFAQHAPFKVLGLPVSRRLVPDTVAIIQPVFYPRLPFLALTSPGTRGIVVSSARSTVFDQAIDLAVGGASMVQIELPPLMTGHSDEELADRMVALIQTLFSRGLHVRDDGGSVIPLRSSMIGVVCAHVRQVSAVVKRLPSQSGILVETADRFQGLERHIMIVHHPLSGQASIDDFHLDVGRLCTMLSRHRILCFLLTRQGIDEMLKTSPLSGDRILGSQEDREYFGWKAHLHIQRNIGKYVVRIK